MSRKNSARQEKKLNCNHGVLITDEIFDAYLKCKAKAHLTFGPARSGESSLQSATGNSDSLAIIRRIVVIVSNLPIAQIASLATRAQKT